MKQDLKIPPEHFGFAMLWRKLPRLWEHRHDEVELNLLLSGTVTYRVGSRLYRLGPNSIAWLFPEQNHVIIDSSPEVNLWVAVFKPDIIASRLEGDAYPSLLSGNPEGYFVRDIGPATSRALEEILTSAIKAQESANADLLNAALFYLLLKSWHEYSSAVAPQIPEVLPKSLIVCLNRIDSGVDDDTASLALECGLGKTHLNRLFRCTLGVTLTDYRNRRRFERFWNLSQKFPEHTLLALALEAGFGSYAQFHRVYRHFCGESPRERR